MTYYKQLMFVFIFMCSFFFRINDVYAIPVPTIGAELATQIDQLTKHIDELKKVKDQITNGIEQAKAMGDKLSMDALKDFAKGAASSALSGGISGLEVPSEMSKLGFTEEKLKDPTAVKDVLADVKNTSGEYDEEKRSKCVAAREKMAEELRASALANSLSLQTNLASGEDMKKAQEASGASDDQMQLIGGNTATLKIMYQQAASSTMLEANNLALGAISTMCDK